MARKHISSQGDCDGFGMRGKCGGRGRKKGCLVETEGCQAKLTLPPRARQTQQAGPSSEAHFPHRIWSCTDLPHLEPIQAQFPWFQMGSRAPVEPLLHAHYFCGTPPQPMPALIFNPLPPDPLKLGKGFKMNPSPRHALLPVVCKRALHMLRSASLNASHHCEAFGTSLTTSRAPTKFCLRDATCPG